MNKSRQLGAVCACAVSLITFPSYAALIGVLPATPGGTDYQAYYDDQLDISWTANANINGSDTWANQVAWAASLDIDGVTGWRLPNMDVNDDGTVVSCSTDQTACKDNEYGHLYNYGAGTVFGSGITSSNASPFSNIPTSFPNYYSGTETASNPTFVWLLRVDNGNQNPVTKTLGYYAWAVHDGDVSAVPIPAAAWLFGSGLLGLIGVARKKVSA